MTNEPRFVHDCKECQFVGQFRGGDAYICDRSKRSGSVVYRLGDEPDNYQSIPLEMADRYEPFASILKLKLTLEGKQP